MKKSLFLLLSISLLSCGIVTAQRFGTTVSKDNTGRVLTYGYSAPAYAATLSVTPNFYELIYAPVTLTGNVTINATLTSAKVGDKMFCLFTSDATGRVITFGAGFASSGTLTLILSKKGSASFVYDGSKYVEIGRAVQP